MKRKRKKHAEKRRKEGHSVLNSWSGANSRKMKKRRRRTQKEKKKNLKKKTGVLLE